MKQYAGKVRVVYKNFVVHPEVVQMAHQAGCAAAKQGKFVAFKNAWWKHAYANHQVDQAAIEQAAKIAGLNLARFRKDQVSDACKQRVEHDQQELEKFHVNSTPTFFVNGTYVGGALPEAAFKQLIDQKLQVVEASGVPCAEYYQKEVMAKGLRQFKAAGSGTPR